jgi:hypothetical protein
MIVMMMTSGMSCRQRPSEPPALPPDMDWVTSTSDPLQWINSGFIELTTPVRPPTSADGSARIVVVMKFPTGQLLSSNNGTPPSLSIPVGTEAARVEYAANGTTSELSAAWRVLDVRQFSWRSTSMLCTVLRPDGDGKLVGLRWPCSAANDEQAGTLLSQFVRDNRFEAPRSDAGRERAASHIAQINGCVRCHQANRREDRSATAVVQRSTDSNGLFSIRSLMTDQDPIERYRPIDRNLGDPFMHSVCPQSDVSATTGECTDGMRRQLRYDIAPALAAQDSHAVAVCASRLSIAAVMTSGARATFASALHPCLPTR